MEGEEPEEKSTDMVKWEDGTHQIMLYNDDNGYGLTRCEKRIGPWDSWVVGEITCAECVKRIHRGRTERQHGKEKGPREWFPKSKSEKEKEMELNQALARIEKLEKELEDLKEVVWPFVLHGKALGALERGDITTIISQKENSYLCLGAFKLLMDTFDEEGWRALKNESGPAA